MNAARGQPDQQTVTLSEAKALIKALAPAESILLLSSPGMGKSQIVQQAATEAGLECRSLLGTQIAPEDVSGIPRIVGQRAVFCPPRVLLPERPEPFCLFLDELPACAPDVQKSFYSLLLERRLGEHVLPKGTWVVAAGNRMQDRALARALSSALVNRVFMIHVRVSVPEWLEWAQLHGVHPDVIAFIALMPEALLRLVPSDGLPFSTPRGWTSLSSALILAERHNILGRTERRALSFGRVSAEDAAVFCAMAEARLGNLRPPTEYVLSPELLPMEHTARWFILSAIRRLVRRRELRASRAAINRFLLALPPEHRFALFVGQVKEWGRLGADVALLTALKEATGL